jgi:2-iminobutanoate/2-iminopropanoate deaminase
MCGSATGEWIDPQIEDREEAMSTAARTVSQHLLEPVHPRPEEAHKMPYAPAIRIVGACNLMFISGATPSPLYHDHPHRPEEHDHPSDIEEQTRRAMAAIQMILDEVGATWSDVVKVTKYLTDMRDADGMHRAMRPFFGDWQPASTMVCINQLSSPGARVELAMIVALPQNPAASR